jgi:hypothetical protein
LGADVLFPSQRHEKLFALSNGRTVLFSGKNIAILGYFSVLLVHGKVGRTTTRIFGVVVLADKLICSNDHATAFCTAFRSFNSSFKI